MLTPFMPNQDRSTNEYYLKKSNHIAHLLRDSLMLMQLDKAFNELMADPLVLQTSTGFRELTPNIRYKFEFVIDEVVNPHWDNQRCIPGGVYHMRIHCRIFLTSRQDLNSRSEYCLTSELSIPGKRKAILAAVGTPPDVLDAYADIGTNFVKTAVNFYTRYRTNHPENIAKSIVSTAYAPSGDPAQGNAARQLIAALELLDPWEIARQSQMVGLPIIDGSTLPTSATEACKVLAADNLRDLKHAEPDDVCADDISKDTIVDMTDPRTMANLLKGIK